MQEPDTPEGTAPGHGRNERNTKPKADHASKGCRIVAPENNVRFKAGFTAVSVHDGGETHPCLKAYEGMTCEAGQRNRVF